MERDELINSHSVSTKPIFSIKTSTILIGLMCFLMILPDDVFGWISLYESITPSSIAYIWLDYSFGIVQLFVLLIGIYYSVRLNKKGLFILAAVMLIRELTYLLLGENSIFSASAYEMYLAVFVGYAFALWAEGGLRSFKECERYFKWFLITNMLTIYINFLMGGAGGILAGRYHSSNLDVGGTGTLCVLCILFLANLAEKKWYDYIFIGLSAIGLFLSGSRANLLFLILIFGLYIVLNMFFKFKKEDQNSGRRSVFFRRFMMSGIALVAAVIIVVVNYDAIVSWIIGSRFQSLFSSQGLRTDDSFLGRTASLTAGLDVLKHHPLGISGYFINLQQEIRMRGYPTFPHSTLLSMYLVFGPVVLILYGLWIRMLKKLRSVDVKYYLMILFLLISTIIYGGPIANFKIIFMIVMTTFLARQSIKEVQCAEAEEYVSGEVR